MDREMVLEKNTDKFSPELYVAVSDLAESLERSEDIFRYAEANQKLIMDQSALQLINEANALQRKVYGGNSYGDELTADLTRLHELQNLIATNDIIEEQAIARETAVAFLREINQKISQLLGFDFASLTRRPGAGC